MTHNIARGSFNADRVHAFANGAELWQGNVPPPGEYLRAQGFRALVLAASEHQPPASNFPGVAVIHAPNDDRPLGEGGSIDAGNAASKLVVEALRRGEKVLVTCAAGLNRSGLVTAFALMRTTKLPVAQIITLVRRARGPWALSNADFVAALKSIDQRRRATR